MQFSEKQERSVWKRNNSWKFRLRLSHILLYLFSTLKGFWMNVRDMLWMSKRRYKSTGYLITHWHFIVWNRHWRQLWVYCFKNKTIMWTCFEISSLVWSKSLFVGLRLDISKHVHIISSLVWSKSLFVGLSLK